MSKVNSSFDLSSSLNRHSVIPPIEATAQRRNSYNYVSSIQPYKDGSLERHLTGTGMMLTDKPIRLTPPEEAELRRRVMSDIRECDPQRLNELYAKIAYTDRHSTGYARFTDIGFALLNVKASDVFYIGFFIPLYNLNLYRCY